MKKWKLAIVVAVLALGGTWVVAEATQPEEPGATLPTEANVQIAGPLCSGSWCS